MTTAKSEGGNPADVITNGLLATLFPAERADQFFEALYGGAESGAFDVGLFLKGFSSSGNELLLEFRLTERPGKCMACSLTYGLPPVFERHPVIDIKGIMRTIGEKLSPYWQIDRWELGPTRPDAPRVNIIPLRVFLSKNDT
jgi:hypothetical protein